MDIWQIAQEWLYHFEAITPSEVKKLFGDYPTLNDLVKKGYLIPTNQFYKDERFYAVNVDVIDFKSAPLSDPKTPFIGYSFNLPTRIEKIIYKWALNNKINISLLKKAWNGNLREWLQDLFSTFLGKPKQKIINELNRYKAEIIKAVNNAAASQTDLAYFYALNIDGIVRYGKNIGTSLANKLKNAKTALVYHVFKTRNVDAINYIFKRHT